MAGWLGLRLALGAPPLLLAACGWRVVWLAAVALGVWLPSCAWAGGVALCRCFRWGVGWVSLWGPRVCGWAGLVFSCRVPARRGSSAPRLFLPLLLPFLSPLACTPCVYRQLAPLPDKGGPHFFSQALTGGWPAALVSGTILFICLRMRV